MKVIEFKKSSPDEDMLSKLEDLLDMCKSGEVTGVAVASINRDGSIGTLYAGLENVFKAIGAIEYLKTRIMDERIE